MNKKAFTLIELIAVIAIIAIVSVVIVRFSNNIFSSVNQRAYELLLEAMQKGANDYLYITDLRLEDDGTEIITVSELIASGAIKSVKDPQNKEDCDGYVEVKRTDNKYVFFPYLHCGTNYITSGYGSTDEVEPVITILGDNPVTLERGTAYTDAEATASDNIDGDITSRIVTITNLNVNAYGTYNVTYTVYDSFNNKATAVRTINVTEDVAPQIAFSINGNQTYAKTRSTKVTVSDDDSGIDSSSLKYQWTTNTNIPTEESFTASFNNKNVISTPLGVTGSYYLWVLAKDKAGNTTISGTNEFKLDNIAPVITLLGSNPYTYIAGIYGTVYTDAGATASDNIDGNITSSIVATSDLNINLMGPFTVRYNVTDSAGNIASEITRIIYSGELQTEVLVVGGGGGGGMDMGGGGGGGGVVYNPSYNLTPGITYNVVVGDGGSGAPAAGTSGNASAHMFIIESSNGGNSTFGVDTSWGSSSSNAGKSCYSLMLDGITKSGVYWIDPDGSGTNTPFQVYCDMDYDGGGWTLLLKATRGTTFNYDSSYWTTANTLNTGSLDLSDADAKFRSYNEMGFNDLMARWPDVNLGNYRWTENNFNGGTVSVLTSFFSSASNMSKGTAKDNDNWGQNIFSSQIGYSFYGFNFVANTSNKVRWGYAWNNENDWNSNDVRGGIGLSNINYSAGDNIGCCQDTTGINRSARVEMYGRNSNDTADTTVGIVALGGGGGGSSYYNYSPGAMGSRGASGGGTSGYSNGSTRAGGLALSNQGYNGGQGGGQYYSGGGGGAGGVGTSSTSQPHGGPGVANSILGYTLYWGGGGGGASYTLSAGGNGGIGGGGGGAVGSTSGGAGLNNGSPGGGGSPTSWTNTPGGNGGANTGGGGGGGSHYNATNKGGDGGSGIVVIKYYGTPIATGGTVSTSGGYTTHTFTSSGAFSVVNNYGDYLAQFLDKDLVSYWKLDESSGNPADSSGGYTSTNSNVSYTTGKINNGGSFNGSTSYTVINNTTSVQFQNQITVSAWVKPASTINAWTDRGIFSKGGSSGNSFLITHIGDSTGGPNDMWGGFVTIAGDNRWVTGTTVPIVGNWYYVVLTYDNSNIKLYVNGNLEKVLAYTGNIQNYTENFVIGARSLSGGTPFRVFNGTIDEVAYWKRALTYGEINYLYNYGVGRQYPF